MTPNQDERLLAQQFETIFTKYYSVVKYFALIKSGKTRRAA